MQTDFGLSSGFLNLGQFFPLFWRLMPHSTNIVAETIKDTIKCENMSGLGSDRENEKSTCHNGLQCTELPCDITSSSEEYYSVS